MYGTKADDIETCAINSAIGSTRGRSRSNGSIRDDFIIDVAVADNVVVAVIVQMISVALCVPHICPFIFNHGFIYVFKVLRKAFLKP